MNVLRTLMGVDRCVQIQLVVTHALAGLAIVWQVMVAGVMVSDYPELTHTLPRIFLIDIDECREGTDGCGQVCSNTFGSYICGCNNGYRLAADLHGCNGISYADENYWQG